LCVGQAPTDIYYQGKLALPNKLKQGYLLDNRGIGKNVAFIKLTYQEYAKLVKAPTLTELYAMIVDKEPLLKLYNCGNREDFSNLVKQLNQIMEQGKLTEYAEKSKN
jgi:S-methylmethionine-dependent homocysteine/selenocysteine methylase